MAHLLLDVRRQMRQTLEEATPLHDWRLTLEVGDPGTAIARAATAFGADLDIVGIGADDPESRRRGTRTAVCTARYATGPVFAAVRGCEAPSRVIVSVVGGRLHAATLRAAVACLLPGGRLWIATAESDGEGEAAAATSESVRALVTRACGRGWLGRLEKVEIARVEMAGDVVAGTLQLADETRAQLIAVANYGAPGPIRAFLPNQADALLLAARCAVLVVPDRAGDATTAALGPG